VKTTVIKLEPYDDVNSTRDKIARCGNGRILIVFPNAYKLLDRRLDLILLIRSSQEHGAQLAIVCDDPEVQTHAREVGLPIFTSVTVAQKLPWRRAHFKRRSLDGHSNGSTLADRQAYARDNKYVAFFRQNRRVQIAAFIVALVAVAALACFFIPSAAVTLPIIKHEQTVEIQVAASPATLTVNPNGAIPAAISSVIIELSGQFPSSGKVVVPDKAAVGRAKFTNLNPMPITVTKGTILIAYSDQLVRFEVTDGVTVPSGSGQTAFVLIQAVKAGSGGNVAAGEIRAIEGSLGLQLTVTNLEATQGGSDRIVASPTQADYSKLKENLLKQLNQSALQELQARQKTGDQVIAPTLKMVSIMNEKRDAEIGTPANNAGLTLRAEFNALYFHSDDVARLAGLVLDMRLNQGEQGMPASLQIINLGDPKFQNNLAQWQIRASRQVVRVWDKQSIAAFVAGRASTSVAQQLAKQLGLESPPRIELSPSWWPFVPLLPFRIEVRTG
jgi:hypothetical protein